MLCALILYDLYKLWLHMCMHTTFPEKIPKMTFIMKECQARHEVYTLARPSIWLFDQKILLFATMASRSSNHMHTALETTLGSAVCSSIVSSLVPALFFRAIWVEAFKSFKFNQAYYWTLHNFSTSACQVFSEREKTWNSAYKHTRLVVVVLQELMSFLL